MGKTTARAPYVLGSSDFAVIDIKKYKQNN